MTFLSIAARQLRVSRTYISNWEQGEENTDDERNAQCCHDARYESRIDPLFPGVFLDSWEADVHGGGGAARNQGARTSESNDDRRRHQRKRFAKDIGQECHGTDCGVCSN